MPRTRPLIDIASKNTLRTMRLVYAMVAHSLIDHLDLATLLETRDNTIYYDNAPITKSDLLLAAATLAELHLKNEAARQGKAIPDIVPSEIISLLAREEDVGVPKRSGSAPCAAGETSPVGEDKHESGEKDHPGTPEDPPPTPS